jgi:hypothetical protein
VAPAHRFPVGALLEALEPVLPDRLQHSEAGLAAVDPFRLEETVGQERLHTFHDVELEAAGHGVGSIERKTTDEDGEAGEEHLLLGREEVVAPLDRAAQCPVTRRRARAGRCLEQIEPLTETLENRTRREHPDPRRRELERKRQAVQAQAELRDRVGVLLRELEVGSRVACAIDEQPHRLGPPEAAQISAKRGVGKAKRIDRVDPLLGNVERRAAGDEQFQGRRSVQQLGQQRGCLEHLLEVVEDE